MTPDKLTGTALALAGSTIHMTAGRQIRVPMPFSGLAEAVSLAEETGYRGVWVPDHGVWDPFGLLAALGHRTHRIHLAPGVVTMPSRPAAAMVAAADTLDRVSGGRAILGLGSGGERRVDRVAWYVDEVRAGLQDRVPVYLAALGPRMVRVAAKVADGVVLNWCTPGRVERARPDLEGITVAVYVRACLGHDEEHALAALREAVAVYAGIPAYRRQFEAEGLGELANAAAGAGRRSRFEEVPVELVDALCIRGGRDEAMERIDRYRAAGADLVVVYPVTAQEPASSLMATIMAAAPDPAVER